MLGYVSSFGLLNQDIGLLLIHLAASDHVVDQIARALDTERAQSCGGSNHLTHGSCHTTSGLEADFVGTLCHLGGGVPLIGSSVPGSAPRCRTRGRRVVFSECVFGF